MPLAAALEPTVTTELEKKYEMTTHECSEGSTDCSADHGYNILAEAR